MGLVVSFPSPLRSPGHGVVDLQPSPTSKNLPSVLLRALTLLKAIADISSAKTPAIGQAWDYSHVLTPQHRAAGYQLHLREHANGDYMMVSLNHGGQEIGSVSAFRNPDGSMEPHTDPLPTKHRNQGLGRAMYEAIYAHANKRRGVTAIAGGVHTKDAERVRRSLARRHGLDYRPVVEKPGTQYPNGPYRYDIR